MSLAGLALMIAASGRLSFSTAVSLIFAGIYAVTLLVMLFGKPIIPEKYETAIMIMTLTFISSLFYLILSMINPVSALKLYFIIFLIPVTFLSSRIEKRVNRLSPVEGIVLGLKEALGFGLIIIAISLIREPLGYGTLSVPFTGRTVNLFSDAISEKFVLQVFAAPLGGFILTASLIALLRLVFRRPGAKTEAEDNDD